MNQQVTNHGVATFGGITNVSGPTAVGTGATVHVSNIQSAIQERKKAVIGIITVIAEEAIAVRNSLNLAPVIMGPLSFDVGVAQAGSTPITLAAIRALSQGQESAMAAYNNLCEHFDPSIVILTGIAGGFHRDIRLGDVVVATRVICYDLRKETSSKILYRGQERQAPAVIGRAVNEFFTAKGEPAKLHVTAPRDSKRVIRVLNGPIGSGNTVIANRDSEVLKYLTSFNDKILAVDMEAAGVSQAHHERQASSGHPAGWLVIRGISDDASSAKNDDIHQLAADNAALALCEILPYLAQV